MITNKKQHNKSENVREQPQPYEEAPNPFIDERYEIINNVRFDLKPAPTVKHQHLAGNLHHAVKTTCQHKGIVLFSPIDVYLDEANQFQPDLVFILNEHSDIIKEARIEGAPDLVAEVLSPSTSQRDKITKMDQYERFGVKEYWIVDPIHTTVDQFILERGKFQLYKTYADEGMMTSPIFACIKIDLKALFAPIP